LALLSIRNLTTIFHTEEGVITACDQVSLDIPAGKTVGLIGETGCGKSVLGMSILRLLPRNATIIGEILYKGQDILSMNADRLRRLRGNEIALLPQSPATSLNPALKIGFQIAEGLHLHRKTPWEQAWSKAIKMLDFLKLPEPEKRVQEYPHQLSGGMKQRALAAASITGRPCLLIADEPTKGLDAILRAQVVGVLRQLVRETGAAMLLITHDLKVAASLCDEIAVMYAGEILEHGDAEQVLTKPLHPYTRGLLASLPEHGLHPIPGYSPGLMDVPAGCKFHRRCPLAGDLCAVKRPPLQLNNGSHVRCLFIDQCAEPQQNLYDRDLQKTAVYSG
jgi:peptide/nickel transport system ATP-binding protein